MRGLLSYSKGAITVFVTLLLIPAILVSGAAVDLARIYTARSIIQDANQLAANAVLSQYDSLAGGLYGLFGVMEDAKLLDMANDCIEVSIFGEDWQNRGLGTFQLFYGSSVDKSEILFEHDKNLKNTEVLRRQIDEYMKFRGPAVIVSEFFDKLEKSTIGDDLEIIKDKMAIDESMQKITEKYRELYGAIVEADKCKSNIGVGSFGSMSASLVAIQEQFAELGNCYESMQNAADGSDEKLKYEEKCAGILEKIRQLASGGSPRLNTWTDGKRNAAGAWVPGRWTTQSTSVVGLAGNIANAKTKADNFKEKFLAVAEIAKQIDSMKSELNAKIDSLEYSLQNGFCDEGLKNGLLDKTGSPPKSVIDRYREALKQDVSPFAQKYKTAGDLYIEEVKTMLDGVKYRDAGDDSADSLTPGELAAIGMALAPRAAHFAGFADVTYHLPEGFIKFSGVDDSKNDVPGWEENAKFFKELQELLNGFGGKTIGYDGSKTDEKKDVEKKQREITDEFLKVVEEAYNSQNSDPKGAKYIGSPKTPAAINFDIAEIFKLYSQAIDEGVADVFKDPEKSIKNAAEYILLLAYDVSMFSNYTTAKPGGTPEKSIAGIPFGPEVNYFYQSEWEYIYNGSESAEENLEAIARQLFMVRLVCNYISVFDVPEIQNITLSVQEAFSGFPLLGVELSETVRLVFAVAESVLDLALLRGGYAVPFIKKNHEWVCHPGPDLTDKLKNMDLAAHKYSGGVSYSTYVIHFLLAGNPGFREGDLFAERTAQLIEWNIINYRGKVNADEAKMSEELKKAGRFTIDKLKTDFQITTTVDMRMLFLSLPFAQKGINGIIPPKTAQFTVSDCRGY